MPKKYGLPKRDAERVERIRRRVEEGDHWYVSIQDSAFLVRMVDRLTADIAALHHTAPRERDGAEDNRERD